MFCVSFTHSTTHYTIQLNNNHVDLNKISLLFNSKMEY